MSDVLFNILFFGSWYVLMIMVDITKQLLAASEPKA